MKIKYLLPILMLIIFFNCSTIKFGKNENIFDSQNEKTDLIRKFDLTYSYKIMGVPVKGTDTIVEKIFIHPDNRTMFLCISFPKIGILKTDDFGTTFTSQYFKIGFLDKIFGYVEEKKETNKDQQEEKLNSLSMNRQFYFFASSPKDPEKIAITFGSYLLLSKNKGLKWDIKNIFFDIENIKIKNLFITDNEEIVIIADNKILVSNDWGKKWKRNPIKISKEPLYKYEYISGLYDNKENIFFASIKHNDESHESLSDASYDFFYNDIKKEFKSGVYWTKDLGLTWNKLDIHVPVIFWKNNNKIFGTGFYPLFIYKEKFSEKFINSVLYKNAVLNSSTISPAGEYVNYLLNLNIEDYELLSLKNNKILTLDESLNVKTFEENNFDNIYEGIKKIHDTLDVHWNDRWFNIKKTGNFKYEYNMNKMFKLWTGMMTNSASIYAKSPKGIYYRVIPDYDFIKVFIKYSLENQIRLNNIKPFLKKPNDIEFFDPSLDPTNGFPALIQYSTDNGATWKELTDNKHIDKIIDPLDNKRSGLYWYKNVEQKKSFKLQLSFGFDKGVNFLIYPVDLINYNDELIMQIKYFTISKSYKDVYLIPVNK